MTTHRSGFSARSPHEKAGVASIAQVFILILLMMVSLFGCSSPWLSNPQWVASDGRSLSYELTVIGRESWVDVDEFSIATWPELEEVPHSATVVAQIPGATPQYVAAATPLTHSGDTMAYFTADEGFTSRWYVLRWSGIAGELEVPERIRGGVALSDGSIIWRFYGVGVPEIRRVISWESGIVVEFSGPIQPAPGRSVNDALRACVKISQLFFLLSNFGWRV